jgi:Zn-dependent protease with chaperone function
MIEWLARFTFPIIAIAVTLLLATPILTIGARLFETQLETLARSDQRWTNNVRLFLLIAPTVIPLVLLFSSAVHYVDAFERVEHCMFDHSAIGICLDGYAIGGGIIAVALFGLFRTRWQTPPRGGMDVSHRHRAELAVIRSTADVPSHVQLRVVENAPATFFSEGRLRATISVDAEFFASQPRSILQAGIQHELAHCVHRDLLSRFFAQWALKLNPFRFALAPIMKRWLAGCELSADREAVAKGANPLDLSQAILRSARHQRSSGSLQAAIGLATCDRRWLEIRVSLLALLAESNDSLSESSNWSSRLPLLRATVVTAFFVPQVMGAELFDELHHFSESLLVLLGWH